MEKTKHINKIRNFISKTPVFTSRDIEKLTKNKKYAHLILTKLAQRREIFRLTKGFYSKFEDPIFSIFCFKPGYLGLYEALSLNNFWEQETNVTIITLKKVRVGKKNILESNVIIKRINPKYFFGFDYLPYDSFYLPVSDLEKTLIDLIYFKESLPLTFLKELRKKIDFKKIKNYLKPYPKNFQKIVLKKLQ